jgi:hypothetical protein
LYGKSVTTITCHYVIYESEMNTDMLRLLQSQPFPHSWLITGFCNSSYTTDVANGAETAYPSASVIQYICRPSGKSIVSLLEQEKGLNISKRLSEPLKRRGTDNAITKSQMTKNHTRYYAYNKVEQYNTNLSIEPIIEMGITKPNNTHATCTNIQIT